MHVLFRLLTPFAALAGLTIMAAAEAPREVSGIYPHLAMFNDEDECGTGAVVPWANRLWVVTYAPHKPGGSSDKLYEITPGLQQIIRPESIGGTPANRMIHRESEQLFIGPHVIGKDGTVRTIPYSRLFGRPTGMARHLTDPAGRVVVATMEEGIYEVDVRTLAVTEWWADEQRTAGRHAGLPGYHGKGFASAQGRYIYANNGDHAREALTDPAVPSGVLAEWDGTAPGWTVVRRNQFTEVTGPGGIAGSAPDDPVWSIGWDHRSLILMLRDRGRWSAFRLPRPSHCYDGAHGWNTEWPRIRDIGERDWLMTMHGGLWRFPGTFSAANTAGIAPLSTYLKVAGDFCRWEGRIVFGCDDTAKSEFLNAHPLKGALGAPGQSQSNLWFVEPERLSTFGPPLGRGAVWLKDRVAAGAVSEPYLFSGYARRSLHLAHESAGPVTVSLEIDRAGDGRWERLRDLTLPAGGSVWTAFAPEEKGAWIRLNPHHAATGLTAMFHYRAGDPRSAESGAVARGLAAPDDPTACRGLLLTRGGGLKTLAFASAAGGVWELDAGLALTRRDEPGFADFVARRAAIPEPLITVDAASALYVDSMGRRWRLPKGGPAWEHAPGARVCREVATERNLLHVQGTFYELPAENAGGFARLRPVTTHGFGIHDFASYRGLLVMSGVKASAEGGGHIVRSRDGRSALWVGAVDDLWQFGKPRGTGGPWHAAAVRAGEPSDPCLCSGYDRKRLTVTVTRAAGIRVEADFTGTGEWHPVTTLAVSPGVPVEYVFAGDFGAYWLRLVSDTGTTATAVFTYD